MKDDPFADYLGVLEVGLELGIHHESVARLARKGRIPMHKVFGKWVIERDVFRQWATRYDRTPGRRPKPWRAEVAS